MLFYDGHKVYMNGKYPAVFVDGKSHHVHRLMWQKHNGAIPEGFVVHHKDGNKLNWNIENLELLSRREHIREHRGTVHRKGVPVLAVKGDAVIMFDSIEQAAEHCGTHTVQIQRCFNGVQKQSHGWTFRKVCDCHSVL